MNRMSQLKSECQNVTWTQRKTKVRIFCDISLMHKWRMKRDTMLLRRKIHCFNQRPNIKFRIVWKFRKNAGTMFIVYLMAHGVNKPLMAIPARHYSVAILGCTHTWQGFFPRWPALTLLQAHPCLRTITTCNYIIMLGERCLQLYWFLGLFGVIVVRYGTIRFADI